VRFKVTQPHGDFHWLSPQHICSPFEHEKPLLDLPSSPSGLRSFGELEARVLPSSRSSAHLAYEIISGDTLERFYNQRFQEIG